MGCKLRRRRSFCEGARGEDEADMRCFVRADVLGLCADVSKKQEM